VLVNGTSYNTTVDLPDQRVLVDLSGSLMQCPRTMDDTEFAEGLYHLHRADLGSEPSWTHDHELLRRCQATVQSRLMDDPADFRVWISRLLRELLLSDTALGAGHGVDEMVELWAWFDRELFTNSDPQELQSEFPRDRAANPTA
jgi:hypothetical protein